MAIGVQCALWGLYGLIPWLALRRWLTREVWPVRLVLALLAGMVSQAILGTGWSLWVRHPAWMEGLYYLGFWVILGILFHVRTPDSKRSESRHSLTLFDQLCIVFLVVLGGAIRLQHPIQVMALGQSDAYTHLSMFREIATHGFLVNAAYPPGYAWILILPAALLRMDPYMMARFGGAFWGVALGFAVYALLREGFRDRRAAMIGAFLVVTFPGLMLLHKTGVGAYANQAGLFFLPLVYAGAQMASTRSRRRLGWGVLVVSGLGVASTVPMLLLHAALVLLLYFIFHGRKALRWLPRKPLRWGRVLFPLLGILLFSLFRFGANTLSMTARILTTADEAASANLAQETLSVWTSIHLLIGDYLSIKRWGTGSLPMDAALILLVVLFVLLLVAGVRRKNAAWIMMGSWGSVAAIQTATGVLQFSAYQREGWSLLIAIACLGGMAGSWIWSRFQPIRALLVLVCLGSAGVTLWFAPAHPLTNSTAEDLLVRTARHLRVYPEILPFQDLSMKGISGFLHTHLQTNETLSLITRPFLQDQMLSAVSGPNGQTWISRWDIYLDPDFGLNQSEQSLIFVDRADALDISQLGSFAGISPLAARNFMQQQRISYGYNEAIETYLNALSDKEWSVVSYDAAPELRIYHVRPKNPSEDAQ